MFSPRQRPNRELMKGLGAVFFCTLTFSACKSGRADQNIVPNDQVGQTSAQEQAITSTTGGNRTADIGEISRAQQAVYLEPTAKAPPMAAPTEPGRSTPATPPATASPAADKNVASPCLRLCEIGGELDCGGELSECLPRCTLMLRQLPQCEVPTNVALECFASHSKDHFECDANTGMPALRAGLCEAEQKAVAECVQSL